MIFNQTYVSPPYVPKVWNDTGKYSYFYIDFKKRLNTFSTGMWNDSILICGNTFVTPTEIEKVNDTTYKIYMDISQLYHGLFITSKQPSRLRTTTGKELPAFAVHMDVAGLQYYLDAAYVYDPTQYNTATYTVLEPLTVSLADNLALSTILDSLLYTTPVYTVSDTTTITLI